MTRAGVAFGGPGNDTIDGYSETMPNLRMYGGPGADRIAVINDRGSCLLVGGPGNDQLRSSGGLNVMRGGPGDDTLAVTAAPLSLFGDTNRISGGDGKDRLQGSPGADVMDGGVATTGSTDGPAKTNSTAALAAATTMVAAAAIYASTRALVPVRTPANDEPSTWALRAGPLTAERIRRTSSEPDSCLDVTSRKGRVTGTTARSTA